MTGSEGEGNPYEGLRRMALDAVAAGLTAPGPDHPHVWGVVIDIPSGPAWATVVALGDGTTSMYTSVGGGTIGAGEHESVRAANAQLLRVVEHEVLEHLSPDPGTHPSPGDVRVHVLGADGLSGIDLPEPAFWGEQEVGGHLVAAAQALISAIRTAEARPG